MDQLEQSQEAYDRHRPVVYLECSIVERVKELLVLQLPSGRLDFDHNDLHDPLMARHFTAVVAVTCVEAGGGGVIGRATKHEWVTLECAVDGSLISIGVDLLVS